MASYNRVILLGGLTRDPESKQLPSGATVTELSLAISEQWKDKSGEQKESTCYVDVVTWNKQAELCAQYLSKGRQILVEGRLQLDEWTNKEGEKRSKLRVRADRVVFMPDSKRNQEIAPSTTKPAETGGDDLSDLGDSSLPF